jgi:hypothetical protein
MRRRVGAFAAAALLVAALAQAGQVRVVKRDDQRLQGLTTVDIVVETSTADDAGCAPAPAALQQTARAALAALGLQASVSERASSWFNTVYLRAESIRVADQCVTAFAAHLIVHVDGIPAADRSLPTDAWGSLLVGELSLARRSGLVASPTAVHARQVERAVVEHLNAIGARIRAANER